MSASGEVGDWSVVTVVDVPSCYVTSFGLARTMVEGRGIRGSEGYGILPRD